MSTPVTPNPSSILPEELEKIKEVQTQYSQLTRKYGELHFQKKFIEEEMNIIDGEMLSLESQRLEIMSILQEKYGAGTIDVNVGTFTPISTTV